MPRAALGQRAATPAMAARGSSGEQEGNEEEG